MSWVTVFPLVLLSFQLCLHLILVWNDPNEQRSLLNQSVMILRLTAECQDWLNILTSFIQDGSNGKAAGIKYYLDRLPSGYQVMDFLKISDESVVGLSLKVSNIAL